MFQKEHLDVYDCYFLGMTGGFWDKAIQSQIKRVSVSEVNLETKTFLI